MSKTDLIIDMLDDISQRLAKIELKLLGEEATSMQSDEDGGVKFTLINTETSNIVEFPNE
jgi:hypothetical protein